MTYDAAKQHGRGCVWLGAWLSLRTSPGQSLAPALRRGARRLRDDREFALTKAVQELLAGSQQDFPVLENDQPIGILRRNDLVKALSQGRRDVPVTEGMSRDCETGDEATSLKKAVESMRERQCATVPVVAGGHVVGLLTLENISEMIMVNAAMEHQGAGQPLINKTKHQPL